MDEESLEDLRFRLFRAGYRLSCMLASNWVDEPMLGACEELIVVPVVANDCPCCCMFSCGD